MRHDKKNTLWIWCIALAVVVCFACCETAAAKAFAHKISVKDPDIDVDIYNPDRTWRGTPLPAKNHKPERPRIIEVNIQGQRRQISGPGQGSEPKRKRGKDLIRLKGFPPINT